MSASPADAVRVCSVVDLEPGQAKRFDVNGQAIAIVRIEDTFYALGDMCSHADVSLSEGDVLVEEREIECWKHGSTFSLETGEPQCLPAVKPVLVYAVVVDDEDVKVVLAHG